MPTPERLIRPETTADIEAIHALTVAAFILVPHTDHTEQFIVAALMIKLVHPFKPEVEAIRRAVLAAAPGIAEGVKWNAPSVRTDEYFATINLRERNGISVILHLGAKVRDVGTAGLRIPDSGGLLKWLARDRALVRFDDLQAFMAKRDAFTDLIRAWVEHV